MSFRFFIGWLALAVCCAPVCRAQSSGQSNAAPAAATASPPLHNNRLKQLEDSVRKSLEGFSPKHVFQDPASQLPLPLPVMPARRARPRQNQDQNDNWMFQENADGSGTPAEQWLKDSDLGGYFSDKNKKKNDVELFYEQLNKQREMMNANPGRGDFKPGAVLGLPLAQDQKDEPDDKLPGGLKNPAKRLKELIGGEKDSLFNPAGNNGLATWFNPRPAEWSPTPDEAKAHKAYMDEYRKLLDTPAPVLATAPGATAAPAAPAYNGLDALVSHALPSVSAGAAGTFVNPGTLPDRNATVLNQWNPLYVPPKPEEPKSMPLFSPPVQVPRRAF